MSDSVNKFLGKIGAKVPEQKQEAPAAKPNALKEFWGNMKDKAGGAIDKAKSAGQQLIDNPELANKAIDDAKEKTKQQHLNDLKSLDNRAFKEKYNMSKEGFSAKNKYNTNDWLQTKDTIDKNKSLENLAKEDKNAVMKVKDANGQMTNTAVTPETRAMLEGDKEVIEAQDMTGKENEIGLRANANQETATMADVAKDLTGQEQSNIPVTPVTEESATSQPEINSQPEPEAPIANAPQAVQEAAENPQAIEQQLSSMTDEETADFINNISEEIDAERPGADAQFKSIWQAWKDGDIDKNTRNYFLIDALANFGKDLANIKHAQNTNAMWANIKSGNQINPAEGISLNNDWKDYLKNDWAKAQELKWDAKKKEKIGNIENALDVAKQHGMDNYLANTKPELIKNSKMLKMWKKDPDTALQVTQISALNDGKGAFSTDDLANMYDVVGNAKLGNMMGDEALKASQLDNKSKTLDNIAKAQDNAFNASVMDIRRRMEAGELDKQQADLEMQKELNKQSALDTKYYEQAKKLGLKVTEEDIKTKKSARWQAWINSASGVIDAATPDMHLF